MHRLRHQLLYGLRKPAPSSTPWTPANLATAPRVLVDARNAVWSGSNLTTVPNSGSNGGTSSAIAGTVIKGTAVNGITPLNFDGSQQLSFGTQAFGAHKHVYLHIGKYGLTHGTLFGLDWTTNTNSFVIYPREGDSGGRTFYFSDGFNSIGDGTGTYWRTNEEIDGNLHIFAAMLTEDTSTSYDYADGVARTFDSGFIGSGAIPAQSATLYMGDSGPTWGPERLSGDVFWAAILDDITDADRLKWEGWASWTFAGDGSLVPSGHPYKAAPPTV